MKFVDLFTLAAISCERLTESIHLVYDTFSAELCANSFIRDATSAE